MPVNSPQGYKTPVDWATQTADTIDRVKAGDVVNYVAQQVGGRGGGRADMAQAGGSDAAALPAALASVSDWLRQKLG